MTGGAIVGLVALVTGGIVMMVVLLWVGGGEGD